MAAPLVFPEVPIGIYTRIVYQPPGEDARNGVVTAVAGNTFTIRLDEQLIENVPRDHLRKAPAPAPVVAGANNLAAQLAALNLPAVGAGGAGAGAVGMNLEANNFGGGKRRRRHRKSSRKTRSKKRTTRRR
jgi:hypothetical protein